MFGTEKFNTKVLLEHIRKPIFKYVLINTSSQVLSFLISLIFIAYISKILNKKEMGIFSLLQIIYSIFGVITNLGLGQTSWKKIPELLASREYKKVSLILGANIHIPNIVYLLTGGIALIFSSEISSIFFKDSLYRDYVVMIIINVFFILLFDRISIILLALQKFSTLSLLNLFNNLSQRILAIVLFYIGYELKGIFFGFLIGSIIFGLLGIISIRKYLVLTYKINTRNIVDLIKFGIPYWIQNIARFGFTQIDQIVVGMLFTPEKLAGYYIAKKIISPIILILEAPLQVFIPKLSENKKIEIYDNKKTKINAVYLGLSISAAVLTVLLSEKLIYIIGGKNYIEDSYILKMLSGYLLCYFIFSLISVDIFILNHPKDILWLNVLTGITSIFITIALAKSIGISGIILGQIGGLLIGSIYGKIKTHNKTNLNEITKIGKGVKKE